MENIVNVLVIEDNFDFKEYLEDLLSAKTTGKPPFRVIQTRTLDEGIERAITEPIDAILLDLGLPDSTGIDTFKKIFERVKNIPIIIVSGIDNNDLEVELLNMGAQGFISKHKINLANLEDSIRHSIARFGFLEEYRRDIEKRPVNLKFYENISDLLKNKINDFSEREWFHRNFVKILIVDDEMVNLLITKKMLSQHGYNASICKSGEDAVEMLKKEHFSLALMDIQMGGMDGYEACRRLKEIKPDIYVIMLTGTVNNESIRKSYQAGAMDFVRKQFDNMELIVRIENAIRIMHSEMALKNSHEIISEKNKLLEKLIITDNLTQLYTRNYVIECLENNIYSLKRYKQPFSLIMLDIDKFKHINDTFGHIAGDDAIKQLADILKKTLRKTDIIGRYGGDEFIILLTNTGLNGGKSKAESIRDNVLKTNFKMAPNFNVTVSIGISEFSGEKNLDDFINKVDNLLYKAKENGRNRVESE